ncbi:trimeric intracellular cation channel family protein [Speluncibacter jeojiensis]|uniref:Trimeric intracellular cation channel family protein n=1 Tax=Speluncibacter jeojiensis TaxID=2710754 RepID=A0A9X4RD46_9ACTN|nr:trimeric intracellular cation channel family protein [Corynebacteriales bacterium D3-21]
MLLTILDLVGIAAFAASGAMIGVQRRLDIFGICVVGVMTGIGGGIIRDLLLGIHPPTSLDTWPNFVTALLTSLVVFFAHPAVKRLAIGVVGLDALGMGLFATAGAQTALDHGAGPLAASLIGATTAIGGGVLRDVLVNEMPLLLHRDLYALPALLGAITVVVGSELGFTANTALVVGTVIATGLRYLALLLHWNLPTAPGAGP